LLCRFTPDGEGLPVLSKIEFAQYVIRPVSHTYTTVLSKSFSYKNTGTSSTEGFVHATQPSLAVVSVGQDSPYGHPHPEVLARWRAAGAQLLTTGERGTITFSTDGYDLKVKTFVQEGDSMDR
jgi:beta-lactamase superfamily II metal-dependent hydrolase